MVNTQTVEVRVAGQVADCTRVLMPLEITHGRDTVGAQCEPPTATMHWSGADCPWVLGDRLEVWSGTQWEPATYDSPTTLYDDQSAVYDSPASGEFMARRFDGIVAGMTARAAAGAVQGWDLDGVGHLARLGTIPINITRPVERDTARVAAIAAAAGVTVRIQGAQGVQLAAGLVDADALTALHDVCESTGGLLWQAHDGTITYETAAHRTDAGEPVGLVECAVIDSTLEWQASVDDITNSVTVRWGPPDAQSEATHTDNTSIAQPWGRRHLDVSTMCAVEADADQLALLILARRAWPFWGMTNGLLAVDVMEADQSRLLAALDVGVPVLLPIPTQPGPTPSDPATVVVEGWVETWAADGHTAQVAFSDQHRWVLTTLRTYDQARADTYAHWKSGTYLDLLVEEG